MNATERISQLKKERRNELRSKALAAEAEFAARRQGERKQVEALLPTEEQWVMAFFQHTESIDGCKYARFCVPTHADLLLRVTDSMQNQIYYKGCWYWDHCDGPEVCDCLADALIAAEYTV